MVLPREAGCRAKSAGERRARSNRFSREVHAGRDRDRRSRVCRVTALTHSRCDAPFRIQAAARLCGVQTLLPPRPCVAAITRCTRSSTAAASGAGSDHLVICTQGACQHPTDHAAFAIVIRASSACEEVTEPKIPPYALTIFSPHSSNLGGSYWKARCSHSRGHWHLGPWCWRRLPR